VALAKPGELAQASPDTVSRREVKTALFANLTSSPSPSKFYPPESARRKERGNVNLKVCADGTGSVGDKLEVLKSSGSKHLDEAAMNWARAATWVPATLNHHRVEGCTQVDVAFEPVPMTVAQAGH
jgi:TonB family protein